MHMWAGIAIGVACGMWWDNLPLGIAMGVALGMAFENSNSRRRRR